MRNISFSSFQSGVSFKPFNSTRSVFIILHFRNLNVRIFFHLLHGLIRYSINYSLPVWIFFIRHCLICEIHDFDEFISFEFIQVVTYRIKWNCFYFWLSFCRVQLMINRIHQPSNLDISLGSLFVDSCFICYLFSSDLIHLRNCFTWLLCWW